MVRMIGAIVAAASIAGPVGMTSTAGTASAEPTIASDKAKAAQIRASVSGDNAKLDALDAEYNNAQLRVAQDSANVNAAKSKLAQAQSAEDATVTKLRKEAVTAYIDGGNVTQLAALVDGAGDNLAVRSYYLNQASNQAQVTVAHLKADQHEITAEQAVYSQALIVDTADANAVKADQTAANSTIASENAQLAQVKGNLATLYRQQEEEEQQQQQQAAEQAAAAQAAQAGDPPVGPAPPPNARAGVAVRAALSQVGKPYVWGGAGPDGYDCSGLVMYAWDQAGVSLSHSSEAQYGETTRISQGQLEPGDLVFYSPPGDPPIGHVNMYIGNGETVEADTTGTDVRVESMFYDGTPIGYGRVN